MRERTYLLDPIKTRAIRTEWGKQASIAKAMAISSGRLNNWLSGRKGVPETLLNSLAECVGVSAISLLTDESRTLFSFGLDKK